MSIVKILILCVVIAVICLILKGFKAEYSLITELAGIIFISYFLIEIVDVIFAKTDSLFSGGIIDQTFLSVLIKALGISIITDIASNLCKDAGNNALSHISELFGKTAILVSAFPMIEKLGEIAIGFINQ